MSGVYAERTVASLVDGDPKVHDRNVVGRGRTHGEARRVCCTDRNSDGQEIARGIQEAAVGIRIAFSALSFFFVIIVPLMVTMSQMSLVFKQPVWSDWC